MQIISIVKLILAIECQYLFHRLCLSLMLIEFLLVLIQLWYIGTNEFIYGIRALMFDELLLDILESYLLYRLDECMVLVNVDLFHCLLVVINYRLVKVIYRKKMGKMLKNQRKGLFMLSFIAMIGWVVQGSCGNEGMIALSQQFSNYTSAKALTPTEQQQLISLYSTLPSIESYTVSIQQNFSFYFFSKPVCVKQSLVNQTFNALKDIWFCFDDFQMLNCNKEWDLVIQCGTYLQFHKPFNPEILVSVNIGKVPWILDIGGQQITNVTLKGLCAGLYHVWFVYYTRAGKFISRVRAIYIAYPGCTC